MSTKRLLLILSALVVLTSCEKVKSMFGKHEDHAHEEKFKTVRAVEQGKDIQIPGPIWDVISGLNFEKAVTQGATYVFSPIKVILTEKNPGILVEPRIEFEFPRGGGEINLSKWVTGKPGSFFVKFDYTGITESESLSIIYVSQARRRRIDGVVYGSGCNQFFDIKNFVLSENKKDGLTVNTTRDRHVSVLGGNFVFAHKKDKQEFVTQVTFTDSEKPELFCSYLSQVKKTNEEAE